MSNDGNLHTNHRERLRSRAITEGLQSFQDHQLLELLLFYALPRIDTNDLAHTLIEERGSLRGVFESDRDELLSVNGVGSNTALLLSTVNAIHDRISIDDDPNIKKYKSMDEIVRFLANRYIGIKTERVYMMLFDNSMKLIDCVKICDGTPNAASLHTGTIIKKALLRNASSAVLAHNHPNGIATPSHEDKVATKDLEKLFKAIGVDLIEHLIIAGQTYTPLIKTMKLDNDPDYTCRKLKNPTADQLWDNFYGESGK